jgi:glyoxylase-like metal-dependent hydrolase (beta-lactamase superfamily II)
MAQQTAIFTSSFFHLQQVAEGVYAALVKEGTGALGNAGFVDLGDEVLVFDTFLTLTAAMDLRKAADQVVGKPVKYVVNSHYHMDHCMGNQVFEGASIISTLRTRELILQKNSIKDLEQEQKQFAEYLQQAEAKALAEPNEKKRKSMLNDIGDKKVLWEVMPMTRLTPPAITFEDRLEIHGSKRHVELLTYGGGHTDSDVFLVLPEERLAFMADLVLVDATPFMGVGHPNQWLTILDRVKELGLKTIIPGHGQVGTEEHIVLTAQYIRFVLDTIRASKARGLSVDEAATMEPPAPYFAWEASMVHEWNIRRLWDQE